MSKPLVVSCGGGIVSALVAFTAHLLGKEVPVYDVSFYLQVASKALKVQQKVYKQLVMGIVHRHKNKLNVQGTS